MTTRTTTSDTPPKRSHHKKPDPPPDDQADDGSAAPADDGGDIADAPPPARAKRTRKSPAADPAPDQPDDQSDTEDAPPPPKRTRKSPPPADDGGDGGDAGDGTPPDSGHPLQDQAKKAVGTARRRMPNQSPQAQVPCPIMGDTEGVVVHPMPESGPQAIVDTINNAKDSIDLEIYQMTDPTIIEALKAAAQRGVKVRVMLEPKTVGKRPYQETADQLTSAGVTVQPTPPKFDSQHTKGNRGQNVDHAKFMVVDDKKMMFGTGNLDPGGLGEGKSGNNRDFWTNDDRPETVSEARQLFDADWNREDTDKINFKNMVVTPDNANDKILGLIDGAQDRLYVYNQEIQDPTVVQHILDAKKRGVDVQVIAGNPKKFSSKAKDGNADALQQFTDAGIPNVELKSLYVHGKGIVADGKTYLGSQNFSTAGLTMNREVGEIFDDPKIADQVAQTFKFDMGNG